MFSTKVTRAAAIGIVVASLVGASATAAHAAVQANGSEGPAYVYNPADEVMYPAGKVFAFNDETVIAQSPTDGRAPFLCSADSTSVFSFVTAIGSERTPSAWVAYAAAGNAKSLIQPTVSFDQQILGSQTAVKTAGGNYSVGIACLKDNNVNLAASGLYYFTAHVTPVTGAYTVEQPDAGVAPTPTVDPTLTGTLNLSATTASAANGVLSLSVPTNAAAAIGSPTLIGGLSTSTGTLGDIAVNDGRVVSKEGWTLSASVSDFTNSADSTVTINKKQLGFSPKIVSTTAVGVVASAAQTAGSSVFPAAVASTTPGSAVGTTIVNADLTFVSPADRVAGTYTSKLTLTLASK
ncbi:MAG: hypothetical protein H7146_02410 [Burkholderiaceae bacterium]|nr:hypothetical protein [Microbacteriaceae bacterium]